MIYEVNISSEAIADIERFLDYIAIEQQAPLTAQRWWQKALSSIDTLGQFPYRCPVAPEDEFCDDTIRMLIIDRCLFLFTIDEQKHAVRIIAFRHGSQLPRPEELPGDQDDLV